MSYLGITLLCLTIVHGSFSNEDIHQFMSLEELERVFHTHRDSVPKYEIVKIDLPERLHKRDLSAGSEMHIRAFGENINLWLHPSESLLAGENTPVYYARYSPYKPQQVEYTRQDGLMGMVGKIFEDPYWVASFVIGTEGGRTNVNGYIGSRKMAVRPLPSRVAEEYRRRRRSVGDFDDLDSHYHVVFKTNEEHEDDYPVLPINQTALRQRVSQSVPFIPDTLYPEILVVVDHSIVRSYGRDIYGLLEYLLAFWNGVDLKYRSLESPAVRFHISAFVLSQDHLATPHISKNSVNENVFNSNSAFYYATEFFYGIKGTFPLDSYDIPVTMTTQVFGEDQRAAVWGLAWVGKACEHSDNRRTTSSVALIRDDAAFAGVHVAAHELGHLLGAPHDNTTDLCVYNDGYLMSFVPWYTKNSSDFSSCSTASMDAALKGSKLDCLFNRPHAPGKNIPRLMPGKIKDLAAQCKARGRGAPCENEDGTTDVCTNVHCLNQDGKCEETYKAALDGTICEGDKFCLHMRCVSL